MQLREGDIVLRPWRPEDAPIVHAACQDEEIQHWIPVIGYWCAREVRGRGIASRALRALCRHGFGEPGLERLELITDTDNAASQRVAEKVGCRRKACSVRICRTRTAADATRSCSPSCRVSCASSR